MTILWQKTVPVRYDSGENYAVYNAIVHNGILWTHGVTISPTKNYLHGYNVENGNLLKSIYLPELDGFTWFVRELAVDQNGYIWAKGRLDKPAFYVVNPDTEEVVQKLFTETTGVWTHPVIRFDPVNNLMWAVKDNNVFPASVSIVGISTETYTEEVTITLSGDYTRARGLCVDTHKGELWVQVNNNTDLQVYRCSDGLLLRTVTHPYKGTIGYLQYVAEKKSVLAYYPSGDADVIISTESYSVTNTYTNPLLYPIWHGNSQRVYGTYYDDDTYLASVGYFDWNHPEGVVLHELLSDKSVSAACKKTPVLDKDVLVCRKAITEDGTIIAFSDNFTVDTMGLVGISFNAPRIITLPSDGDTSSNNNETINYDAFNRELILDLTLGAFSVYDIAHTGDQFIRDYIDIPPFYLQTQEITLYRGTDIVTDTIGDPFTIGGYVSTVNRHTDNRMERFKFLVTAGTDFSLAEYRDYTFLDWRSLDGVGVSFNAYLLTGYELSADLLRQKQSIYLKIFFERTEDSYVLDENSNVVLAHQSGCQVQSQWNWNNSFEQGKWGIPFQGYRLLKNQPANPSAGDPFNYAERVVVTKNKLRGRGHCLSLLFVPECGKDTKLLGWALENTRNDTP